MKLSKFLSSRTGKRFYNLCYCWGACLVILGAVFKIAHMPYDNLLLMIGLFTEVFIFFISGFDEPAREYKWERVFPLLNDKNEAQIKGMTEHAKSLNDMNSEELKKEMEKMAAYIELLNKQYSQMLNAMNVKTGK